jgi:signal transduction histidine kinase/ligand-binding sensor domain-containing protein
MRGRHLVASGVVTTMLLAFCPRAHALDPSRHLSQYAHASWRVRDGHFKGAINAITQTPDGYLWLGTEFGLVRFDGVSAVPWQPAAPKVFSVRPVVRLLTTRDGTLWIGADPGLASLRAGTLTEYPELADQRVSALLEDREGTVWAGSSGTPYGRLCSVQGGSVRCAGEDGAVGSVVAGLYEDKRGALWAGVPNGLWRWKPGRPQLHAIPDHPSGVRPLGEDDDGAILITWHRRITRFFDGRVDPSSAKPRVPDDWTWRFLDDRDGVRWIAMQSRGLARMQPGRTELFTEADGLSGDSVRDLFEDREGNLWVATLGGLDRFRDLAVSTLTQKQGLATPLIWSVLAARDGSVWMGSGLGLSRWRNGRVERFGREGGLLNGEGPGSLLEDRRGRIWASTNREFGYLEGDLFVPVRTVPGGYVFSIVQDSQGDLWIMNHLRGVLRLRGEAVQEFSWATLGRTDFATSAIADPRRGIWLGFEQGGVAHFSGDELAAVYSEKDGLGAGEVHHLRFDSSGALWAATKGGLTRIKGESVATLSSRNGLPCETVHWSIEDDARALWLYTACGLVRIGRTELDAWTAAVDRDPHAKRDVEATVLDDSDGVRSNLVVHSYKPRVAKTPDGRIWFLPVDGVSTVDPRRLGRNELPPPVHVERITADHTTYDAVRGLRLPPLVRDLQIDYAALSFVAPEKNQFRVRLEGRDRDWRHVGTRRHAVYTDLPPGPYRFRVTASNNHGVWNEEGAALDFSIAPAFYQTPWARALAVLAFAALLWSVHRVRMRIVERHQDEISSLNERLMKAQEQERTRIAGELHDGAVQQISALHLMLGTAKRQVPQDSPARTVIADVQQRLMGVGAELRQLSHDLLPPLLQALGLPEALRAHCDEFSRACGIAVSCAADDGLQDISPGTALALYRVAQEALGNAAKHAAPNRIDVRLERAGGDVVLTVADDGRGCDSSRIAAGGLGLINMRERARQLRGSFRFTSRPGRGTKITVKIPFRAREAPATPAQGRPAIGV